MESVTVIAGSGQVAAVDGIGTAAAFGRPKCIFYSEVTDALLIAAGSAIRSFMPVTERRRSGLKQIIASALFKSGALPVQPHSFQ